MKCRSNEMLTLLILIVAHYTSIFADFVKYIVIKPQMSTILRTCQLNEICYYGYIKGDTFKAIPSWCKCNSDEFCILKHRDSIGIYHYYCQLDYPSV